MVFWLAMSKESDEVGEHLGNREGHSLAEENGGGKEASQDLTRAALPKGGADWAEGIQFSSGLCRVGGAGIDVLMGEQRKKSKRSGWGRKEGEITQGHETTVGIGEGGEGEVFFC